MRHTAYKILKLVDIQLLTNILNLSFTGPAQWQSLRLSTSNCYFILIPFHLNYLASFHTQDGWVQRWVMYNQHAETSNIFLHSLPWGN